METKAIIENETQYEWACRRVDELLPLVSDDTPTTDPHYIELNILSSLIEEYEEAHFPIGKPSLIEVIKLRMYEMGLNQLALSNLLGISASRVCEFLSGKKQPTLAQAREISQRLNIDPAIVLGV